MKNVSMDDLYKSLAAVTQNDLILDVREPEEFQAGHVPGSRNIPLGTVHEHVQELTQYERVFVHCQRGGRAGKAGDVLSRLGLKNLVCVTGSGMADWIAAGYPVER
jgi:rhodanese-related sulfurtransferase